LVDRRSLLPDLFNEEEIVVFDDLKDAREKIDHFLWDEKGRRQYAEKAHRRVLKEHTYDLRMKELLGTLYEQGLEVRRPDLDHGKETGGSLPPELRQYVSHSSSPSVPRLEEIVERIRRKKEVTWEDRVFLTLMAFKEEAGCKISSW
jgi:spore maturation protein CgeB